MENEPFEDPFLKELKNFFSAKAIAMLSCGILILLLATANKFMLRYEFGLYFFLLCFAIASISISKLLKQKTAVKYILLPIFGLCALWLGMFFIYVAAYVIGMIIQAK